MITREFSCSLPVSAAAAFAWHERPGAFLRLTPPWEDVHVLGESGGIRDGGAVVLETRVGFLKTRWSVTHRDYRVGEQFVDEMQRGPFRVWRHEHMFEPAAGDALRSTLTDRLTYELPGGRFGHACSREYVRQRVERLFAYRHALTTADLALWARWRDRPRLRIALTGASGLVGQLLRPLLRTQGHEFMQFVRREPYGANEAHWDPARGMIDRDALARCDAVIHLSGENVGEGRWTAARRERLRTSRLDSTTLLARTLAELPGGPRVWVSASATGVYGDTGDREADETTTPGAGFLAELTRDWEAATQPASAAGVRVVNLRVGVVLSPRGGALAKLLPAFHAGLGGRLGSGEQWMSWISPDDLGGAIVHALHDDSLRGPVNACAPEPVRQRDFAATLARVLHRPALLPVPAFVLRALFGPMADEAILGSARALPRQLEAHGFGFRHRTLEAALRHLLGKIPVLKT